jgi:hypothetical protein
MILEQPHTLGNQLPLFASFVFVSFFSTIQAQDCPGPDLSALFEFQIAGVEGFYLKYVPDQGFELVSESITTLTLGRCSADSIPERIQQVYAQQNKTFEVPLPEYLHEIRIMEKQGYLSYRTYDEESFRNLLTEMEVVCECGPFDQEISAETPREYKESEQRFYTAHLMEYEDPGSPSGTTILYQVSIYCLPCRY